MRILWLGAVLLLGSSAAAQQIEGLRVRFEERTLRFRILVTDLQDAYQVTPQGDIRLLPFPTELRRQEDEIQVEVSGRGRRGLLRLRRGETDFEIRLASDNTIPEGPWVSGLPFGYRLLPEGGSAAVGSSWEQSFPAPGGGEGLPLQARYRYTLRGVGSRGNCGRCAEIAITGLRRFESGPALEEALEDLKLQATDFYTGERPFALGSAWFDLEGGFLYRLELMANPSMFTPLPVPGMMRRIEFERISP